MTPEPNQKNRDKLIKSDLNISKKISKKYGGFLFLAEDSRGIPWLKLHRHAELELNLVIRGSVTYIIGNNRYKFNSGELFWLFPSQAHHAVERTPDSQYYVAVFTPALIRKSTTSTQYNALSRKTPPDKTTQHCALSPSDLNQVRELMDRVLKEGEDPDVLNREAGYGLSPKFRYEHRDPDFLNATLAQILILCWKLQLESQRPNPAAKLHPGVLNAVQLLKEGAEPETLEELAKLSGVSPGYLSRLFHSELGITINAFRNSLRMDRAYFIHQNSKRKITLSELAYEAGFKSYVQFYRVCRSKYGRDPKELFK